ncbi:MAG: hypothetical protein WA214_01720, partial [Pseudolabrys sp.]
LLLLLDSLFASRRTRRAVAASFTNDTIEGVPGATRKQQTYDPCNDERRSHLNRPRLAALTA